MSVQDGGNSITWTRWPRLYAGAGVDGASVGGGSSSADPTRTTVAYVDEAGNIEPRKVAEHRSAWRATDVPFQDLTVTRNTLASWRWRLPMRFNAQHTKGCDADGNKGKTLALVRRYIATVIMPIKRYR